MSYKIARFWNSAWPIPMDVRPRQILCYKTLSNMQVNELSEPLVLQDVKIMGIVCHTAQALKLTPHFRVGGKTADGMTLYADLSVEEWAYWILQDSPIAETPDRFPESVRIAVQRNLWIIENFSLDEI